MALIQEAGIPAGVVNLLSGGRETGDALVRHPLVQKVSFTGGPATAREILAACAESLKPAVLELGGKSANMVFPDADLDAVSLGQRLQRLRRLGGTGLRHSVANAGARTTSTTRSLSESSRRPAACRPVTPFDPGTDPQLRWSRGGPAARSRDGGKGAGRGRRQAAHRRRISRGGRIEEGFYVEPTVFGDVDPASELGQVEVFGPVLSLLRFSTEEEAVRIANSTPYGLASYVWTRGRRTDQPPVNAAACGRRLRQRRQPGARLRAAFRGRRNVGLRT